MQRLIMINLLDLIFEGYVRSFVLDILCVNYVMEFVFYKEVLVFISELKKILKKYGKKFENMS